MYTDRETAPLKFFRFYQYVTLPISTIVVLINMVSSLFSDDFAEIAVGLLLAGIYYIPFIIISIIAFIGLIKWKIVGFTCVLIRQWVNVVFCFVVLFLDSSTTLASQFIVAIIWAVGITIYFKHRKKLFDPCYLKTEKNTENIMVEDNCFIPQEKEEKPKSTSETEDRPRFCRNCGKRLVEGSMYCHYCGTSTGLSEQSENTPKTENDQMWI